MTVSCIVLDNIQHSITACPWILV